MSPGVRDQDRDRVDLSRYHVVLDSALDVDVVDWAGSDPGIALAAQVSTGSTSEDGVPELLDYLLRNRHGSPFEHAMVQFRISAPVFVWREFMRHRVGVSYNEQSGRYREMKPRFYLPPGGRDLEQVGRPADYELRPGSTSLGRLVQEDFFVVCALAWTAYQHMLVGGAAKEVARMVLPLNVYSTAHVTMNPRSLMHFLSLRTLSDDAAFPSRPMVEIPQVAYHMEAAFAALFPGTYAAFVKHGRVAP